MDRRDAKLSTPGRTRRARTVHFFSRRFANIFSAVLVKKAGSWKAQWPVIVMIRHWSPQDWLFWFL